MMSRLSYASWTLPRPDQDRAVAIMRSPKLQQWITITTSSALFVNGNHQASRWQQPTSCICAKLIESIQPRAVKDYPKTSIATFTLAGEHLQQEDPDSGLDGMMRSLLAQLLLAYSAFDLRTMRYLLNINYDDIHDLCTIFKTLITQLPPQIVTFCIIDAINYYEDNSPICEEANLVMEVLTDVVELTREGGCAFKLLLMSPWNSRVLYQNMVDQEKDVLWMPAKVPSLGGFTAAGWSADVGSHMAMV